MQQKTANFSKFSASLCEIMDKQGVTQRELAEAIGISPAAVHKYQHGSIPRAEKIAALEAFFRVPPGYFFAPESAPPDTAPPPPQVPISHGDECPELAEIADELTQMEAEFTARMAALRAKLAKKMAK